MAIAMASLLVEHRLVGDAKRSKVLSADSDRLLILFCGHWGINGS
jgi:hypothetical protein